MKIKIEYTWYRSPHNKDDIVNWTILDVDDESKKGVTNAIREWASGWTGKGFIYVKDVYNTQGATMPCCDIKQRKFCFN